MQHQALITTNSGKKMLAGGVDGSVTPEQIPDITAYRLFMNAVAEPVNATPDQVIRQHAKLGRALLSSDDSSMVFQILASYRQQRENLTGAYQTAATPDMVNAYNKKRDEITSSAMASLRSSLSADGAARLDAYIQSEKRHMTIVPSPQMP